ncbi:MAG: hypothetical protein ACK4TA_08915 [Saprospiraceae bacterium]
MKKTTILLVVFTTLVFFNLQAQKLPCWVVTTNADTLTGIFIKANHQHLVLQSADDQRIELQPETIYEYLLLQNDGTSVPYQFIKHPETGKRKPMQRLVDGYYKLFLDKEPAQSTVNPALPKNTSMPHQMSVYYLASYSEDAIEVSSKNWETVLKTYLADCDPLIESIERKKLKFKDLSAMVASYNAYMRRVLANQGKLEAPIMEK